ncbi:MAG: hypothetical protein HFG40_02250 [Bacilli bacterium]|nr:hypothetical protein [Bacilli bacterium]
MSDMEKDKINPTLATIYTSNENIKGMLACLEVIMDDRGYSKLYDEYLEIEKEIPRNEIVTEEEEKWGSFGVDVRYFSIANKLDHFFKDLIIYNNFKELSDCLNDITGDTKNLFNKEALVSVDEYIEKNKQLIEKIIDAKNSDIVYQFTNLMDRSIETLFDSLKTLSFVGREDLLISISETNSDYLREHLASKIRQTIDVTEYKGDLEEDYVNSSTIYECAKADKKITSRQKEAEEFEERQQLLEREIKNYISELKETIQEAGQSIQVYTDNLLRLKLNRKGIIAKKVLFNLTLVPLIVIPLSCPFLGHKLGKSLSSKIILTKTYTKTVDMDSGKVVSSSESYEELNTSYVASVTIWDPWKKNLSGSSYSRNGVVYDYTLPEEVEEDFHLTLDTIDPENLVKKYPLEETTSTVDNKKYLTESQIYVTETYQDVNQVVPSTKYNIPYTVSGLGLGILLGTSEVLGYYLGGKKWINKKTKKVKKALKENEEETEKTTKVLKKTLEEKETMQKEYDDLTKK